MNQTNWIALDEACDHLACLLNALDLMVLGLVEAQDPFADGFYILNRSLSAANQELQTRLSLCQGQNQSTEPCTAYS